MDTEVTYALTRLRIRLNHRIPVKKKKKILAGELLPDQTTGEEREYIGMEAFYSLLSAHFGGLIFLWRTFVSFMLMLC